jgi:biotin transport system substrate-specific component
MAATERSGEAGSGATGAPRDLAPAGAPRDRAATGAGGSTARPVALAALVAALLAASSLLALPLGPVPVTMQVLIVVLAALLLTPGTAALAVGVYLLEGAVGLPVFAGMLGGVGVLAGPTGGYLFGFLAGAVAGAWVRTRLHARGAPPLLADACAAAVTLLLIYVAGVARLAAVTGMAPLAALGAGAAPFIVPDAFKAAAAVAVAGAVRRTRSR